MIEMAANAVRFILALGLCGLHAFGMYAVLLVVAGLLTARRAARGTGAATSAATPLPRIAAIVVAHDEERVVDHSVKSLVSQDYPRDRFDVIVVADHCTDGTARVAREAGATVVERSSGQAEGKPAAVAFGVHEAAALGVDAVAIFDADNHVDGKFLSRMAERLQEGQSIVQGLVDAKNPGASWVSGSSALGFWAIAEIAQRPRERLGLSVPLMGTGFAMRLEEGRALLERAQTLTDDLETGARIALTGLRVAFEPEAITFDEKPHAIQIAAAQRKRWMQGRWHVAEQYVPKLVVQSVSPGKPRAARLRMLDLAVQLLSPSLLFIGVATCVASAVLLIVEREWLSIPPSAFAYLSFGMGAGYYILPAPFIARHRPPASAWACYLVQPGYLALSAPLAVRGFFSRKRKGWFRTPKG